jgi:replicative DNA helicase
MGKTAFALNVAKNMALKNDIPIAFFCLEMTKEQLAQRLLCSEARVDLHNVRTGYLSTDEWDLLTRAADALYRSKIVVDDEPSLDPRTLRAKARRIKSEFNIEALFVDYLQLMHLRGSAENRQQEISEISRSLKLLARELNVVVVALSQLSRAVEQRENKRPRLSDLRESGAIEQDADMVSFLYREEYYKDKSEALDKPHETEMIIGKQRNGPIGIVKLTFNPRIATFFDKAPDVYDQ